MLWKVYCWVLLVIGILSILTSILDLFGGRVGTLYSNIAYLNSLISILGVYCFVYSKRYITIIFWKYFFWINIVWIVLTFIQTFFSTAPMINHLSFFEESTLDTSGISEFTALVILVPLLILILPSYYAMYKLSKGKYLMVEKKKKVRIQIAKKSKQRTERSPI